MPRKKKSGKTNTLICTIPGLRKPIEVPFEARKLPVCKKCKKIYKTRQLCRVRDCHTALPWNTTYICFVLDDSCIVNGKFAQLPGDTFVAEMISDDIPPVPYIANLNKLGPNPPICRLCKEKNYTRYHCRTNHCHKQLPWGTTYAVLKRIESGDTTVTITEGSDSIEESISIPTLDSPSTVEGHARHEEFAESRNDFDFSVGPMKRSASGEQDEMSRMKRARTKHVDHHALGFGYEDITQISACKAFVLIIHEEMTYLHWLRTGSCDEDQTSSEINQSSSVESQRQTDNSYEDLGDPRNYSFRGNSQGYHQGQNKGYHQGNHHQGHHRGHHQGYHQGHHQGHHHGHHQGHYQGHHQHQGHHQGRHQGHYQGHHQGHHQHSYHKQRSNYESQTPTSCYPFSSSCGFRSRNSSPFQGSYADMSNLEPMPYNPHPSQGYRGSDYFHNNYHMQQSYNPRFHPNGSETQDNQQHHSQIAARYDYRHPPSPPQRSGPTADHQYTANNRQNLNLHTYHNYVQNKGDHGSVSESNYSPIHNFHRQDSSSWGGNYNDPKLQDKDERGNSAYHRDESLRWNQEQMENKKSIEFADNECTPRADNFGQSVPTPDSHSHQV